MLCCRRIQRNPCQRQRRLQKRRRRASSSSKKQRPRRRTKNRHVAILQHCSSLKCRQQRRRAACGTVRRRDPTSCLVPQTCINAPHCACTLRLLLPIAALFLESDSAHSWKYTCNVTHSRCWRCALAFQGARWHLDPTSNGSSFNASV